MKFVALLSGGKDSVFAATECVRRGGHELVCGANLAPARDAATGEAPLETDSYMYQTAASEVAGAAMAECLGVPLVRGAVTGRALHQGLAYAATAGDEVEDLLVLLAAVPGAGAALTVVLALSFGYLRLQIQ